MVTGLLFLVLECVVCSVAIGAGLAFFGVLGRFVGLGQPEVLKNKERLDT